MKIILEINKKIFCPVSNIFLKKVAEKSIKKSGLDFLNQKNISLSLAFLSAEGIKKVNKKYRKIHSSTDILSFPSYRDTKAMMKEKSRSVYLGELLADYEYIKKSAKVNKVGVNIELAYVISHGIFHLLGMRHGEKMFALQDKVVQELI
jgi:probable rRNA maturation factor